MKLSVILLNISAKVIYESLKRSTNWQKCENKSVH